MSYLSIQTLLDAFQGSISLLPLLMVVWKELKINEKLQYMGVNKHHGVPFQESVCHISYLPFINGKSGLCVSCLLIKCHYPLGSYLEIDLLSV
jgi:hypothetical protein